VLSARLAGIKRIIFGVHNLAQKRKTHFEKYQDSFIGKNTSYFITASKTASSRLINNRNFDNKKVIQIFNTLIQPKVIQNKDSLLKTLNIDNNRFIIVQVALLTHRKGQLYLLKALKSIKSVDKDTFNNIQVLMVGDGEDRFKLEDYVKSHQLEDNVRFLGHRTDYMDFINSADLFILPSIKDEDMPLVILSAMSLKKAIISTQLAGIAEQIPHNSASILLEVNQLDKLSDSIIRLYNDEALRKKLGENAHNRYMKYFDYNNMISKYIGIYNKLLEKNKL